MKVRGGGGGSQLISKSPILEGVLFKINCEDISMCKKNKTKNKKTKQIIYFSSTISQPNQVKYL